MLTAFLLIVIAVLVVAYLHIWIQLTEAQSALRDERQLCDEYEDALSALQAKVNAEKK